MAATPVGNTRSGLRWSGIAAIAFVVLFVVGFVLTTDTPDGNESNAVWRRYFLDSGHRTGMIIGAFAFALAGLAFLVFLSVLRERLRHASTGAEWVATLSFASGIAFVAFLGVAALGLANIAADVEFGDSPVPRDASIMRSFESLGMGSMLVFGMAAAGLLILTTSIVAGRTAQRIIAFRAVGGGWGWGRGWRRSRCRCAEDVNVARDERRRALQRGDELGRSGTIAIGVVVELPGARVVDDAIVRIVAARRAGSRIEAHVARREAAVGADVGEGRDVELDTIPVRRE